MMQVKFESASSMTYDADGELKSDGTNTYAWDGLKQMMLGQDVAKQHTSSAPPKTHANTTQLIAMGLQLFTPIIRLMLRHWLP
jgi:hypothetical protein